MKLNKSAPVARPSWHVQTAMARHGSNHQCAIGIRKLSDEPIGSYAE